MNGTYQWIVLKPETVLAEDQDGWADRVVLKAATERQMLRVSAFKPMSSA